MKTVVAAMQANFVLAQRPFEDPVPPEAAPLDLVTLVLNYHDISYLPVDRDGAGHGHHGGQDAKRAGFALQAEGAFMRNPADTREGSSNKPPPSDKFVLRFVKR